jgi:2-dehydropantoate 2-reductase
VPEIQRLKFKKNVLNCAFSSFSTLSGYTLHAVFRQKSQDVAQLRPVVDPRTATYINENTLPTIRAVISEIMDVGRAYGFPDTEPCESGQGTEYIADGIFNRMQRLHTEPDSKNIVSMLLDVRNGRPIEVECIVGEVIRMGHAKGVQTPVSPSLHSSSNTQFECWHHTATGGALRPTASKAEPAPARITGRNRY